MGVEDLQYHIYTLNLLKRNHKRWIQTIYSKSGSDLRNVSDPDPFYVKHTLSIIGTLYYAKYGVPVLQKWQNDIDINFTLTVLFSWESRYRVKYQEILNTRIRIPYTDPVCQ